MSFKRIAGSSSERYRLLISDGMYSNSYAMLATQLNKMVTDSTLDEFCVIKVKRLQCNTMQGKKVIIILDMEVLRPGSQVRTFWLIMVLIFFHTFNMKTKKLLSQTTLITNVTQILPLTFFCCCCFERCFSKVKKIKRIVTQVFFFGWPYILIESCLQFLLAPLNSRYVVFTKLGP